MIGILITLFVLFCVCLTIWLVAYLIQEVKAQKKPKARALYRYPKPSGSPPLVKAFKPLLLLFGTLLVLQIVGIVLHPEQALPSPPPPSKGLATVSTGNASPESMRVVLTSETDASEKYYFDVDPCRNCQTHVGKIPDECPAGTAYRIYGLRPGSYKFEAFFNYSSAPYVDRLVITNQPERHCFFSVHAPLERHSLQ